jgi:hypothetical protein
MPRGVYSFISRCLGRADVLRLAGFHQAECLAPLDKAGSRGREGAFRARRASNKYQFFAPGRLVFLLGQFAIGFQNHLKCVLQVFASLFQRLPLGVDPRNFLYPGSPPITHLLVCGGQLHVCIFIAFGVLAPAPHHCAIF